MPRARSLSATRSMASLDVDAPITRSSGVAQVNTRVVSKVGSQQTNQQRLSSNTGRQSLGSSQSAAGSSLRSSGVYVSQLDDVDDEEHKSASWGQPSWSQGAGAAGARHISSAQPQDGRGQQRHDELALLMKELVSVRSHLSQRAREEEASRRALEGEVDALQVLRHQEAKAFSAERMQLATHFQQLMQQVREVQSASSSETRSLLSQLSSTSEASSVREGSYVAQVSEQGATIEAQAQQIAHLRLLALGGSDEKEGAATAAILQTALQDALQMRDAEVSRLRSELTALRASWETVLAAQQAQDRTWSEAGREELRLLRSRASASDSRVAELQAALSSSQAAALDMMGAGEREKEEIRAQARVLQQAAEANAAGIQAALASCQSELALARQERDAAVAELSSARAQHSAELEGKDKALQALEQALHSLTASTARSAEHSDRQLAAAREEAVEARAESASARKALLDTLSRHAAVEQALRRDVAQAHDLADTAAAARESAELQYSGQLQALAGRLSDVEAASDRTQADLAAIIQDLRTELETAEAALARQAQEAVASYKSAEASWRELLDTYIHRCGSLQQQLAEAESLLAQEREAAAARESSLRAALASTRLEAEHVAKGWSARVSSSESRVAQLEESLRAVTGRLHAATAIRAKLGLEVLQAGAGPTTGAQSTPTRTSTLVGGSSSSSSSAAVVLSPPSPSAHAPPATFTDSFVEGVMAPGAAGGSSARRSSMGIVGLGAEARRLSLGGASALPLPPPPSFPLPGHSAAGGGLRSRSASFTGVPLEPGGGALQPPVLPAALADAVRTLGACALVQGWAQNRAAAVQAYTALSTAVDQSSERIKSALAPSESTRVGLAKEVAGLRQSLADAAAGRAEARAALDTLKTEAEAKQAQEEEWASNARAAASATSAALQSALVAAQAASAACVAHARTETAGELDRHAASTAQLSAMQASNDELRASLTALTQRGQQALESLSSSHLSSSSALQERAGGLAALLASHTAQGQAKEAAAREELEALQQKLSALQRTSEADCSALRTLVGEAKAVARAACASRDAAGEVQGQQVRLLQEELERLSSAALQAATVSSAASEAVRARYQAWCEGRELGPGGYKQALDACRRETQAHVEASEAKAAAFKQMVDAVEAALRAMRSAEAAREAANRGGADISSRLVQHARATCATLAARLQGATERSQAEIDALRQQLAGTDAQAAARLTVLVNRAHKLLSEHSSTSGSSGGALGAQDRVLLQSLLERLGGGEKPGRAGTSSSTGSVADLAFTELSTLQRQADFLTRQLSQAQADRGREADRYAGELLKVQGLVDVVRQAYQQATAAVHASTSIVSPPPSTSTTEPEARADRSALVGGGGGGGGVGRGLGLSSPEMARGTSALATGSASYSEVGLSSPFDAPPPTAHARAHAHHSAVHHKGHAGNPLLSSLRVGVAAMGQPSATSSGGDSLPGASVHVVSIDLVEGLLTGGGGPDDSMLLLPHPPPAPPAADGAQQGTGGVGARAVLEDLASPTGPAPSMRPLPYHSSVKQGEGSSDSSSAASSASTTARSTEGLGKRVSLGGVPLLGETGSLPPPPPPVHMLGQSLGGQSIGQMDLNVSSTTAGDLSGTVRLDSSGTGLGGGGAGVFLSP